MDKKSPVDECDATG